MTDLMTSEDIEALRRNCAQRAFDRYEGVLPEDFKIVRRGFGLHGYRWEARAPRATAYCGHLESEAVFEIWWFVFCEDDYNRRKAERG